MREPARGVREPVEQILAVNLRRLRHTDGRAREQGGPTNTYWRYPAKFWAGKSRRPTPVCLQHFLAIVTAIGVAAVLIGAKAVGVALVFAGVGSMLAAALVLLLSSPDKARAAITQGTLPLIAVVLLVIGLWI